MLHLIQRQKPGNHEDVSSHVENSSPIDTPARGQSTDHQSDVHFIASDIAAIKLHQVVINTDLNLLKSSNQQLWKEVLESRDKYKTQQDTINRIVEFLAGVFSSSGSSSTGYPNTRAFEPRLSQKLIGDGPEDPVEATKPIRKRSVRHSNEPM
jgi:hypothetical protein